MRCPYCQKNNPEQAKFCGGCGRKLEVILQPESDFVSLQDAETEKPEETENVRNPETKPSANGSGRRKKKKTGYLVIPAVILAVILVVVLVVSLISGKKDKAESYLEAAQNYGEVNARLIDVSEDLDGEDVTTDEAAGLYQDALEELEAEGLIQESSVVYDESISEISYHYADGVKGSIQLEEIEEGTSSYGLDTYVTGYNEDGYASSFTGDPVSFDIEGYPYEEEDLTAYACWGLGEGHEDALEAFEGSVINWNKAYLTTQIDYDLTLAELRSDLKGYNMVVIQLHGVSGTGYPVLEDGETWIEYKTSYDEDLVLTQEEIETIEDLQAGRVMMALVSGVTYFNYVACPEFFTYYYGDNGLEGSIVWLGCCEGYLYDDLVDAFYSCGASAVLACTESVKTAYNIFMLNAFVYSLLYGNTVDESLSFAQSVCGENDSIFWERYASGQDDYEADTSPAEIRYCEGSADAVLVTLTEEAVAYLENPRIELDDYLDDFDAFYELVGGTEHNNLTDHDRWIVGDDIEYGNDPDSSAVNDLSISSQAYELFDLYVGMKIDDAEDLLSDWEEDSSGDGWIHWSRDNDALCLYYDSRVVTTIQYSHGRSSDDGDTQADDEDTQADDGDTQDDDGDTQAEASGTCGNDLTWVLDSEGTLTISGTGDMENYSSNGAWYSDSPMFSYWNSVRRIVIESGVTSIGDYAFFGFMNNTEVVIPDSVTVIGSHAFFNHSDLTEVIIPDSVTVIGDEAFGACGLTSITISDSVTSLGDGAFSQARMTEIEIPASVTDIGADVFYLCVYLDNITFEGDAPQFDEETFTECDATCYYPADNTTWTSDVLQKYGGGIIWRSY